MNQWLTEKDLRLDLWNISRDDLTNRVFYDELKVYKRGAGNKSLDIPRSTEAQEKAERENFTKCFAKRKVKSPSLCKNYGGFPHDFCFDLDFEDKALPHKDGFRCRDEVPYIHCFSNWKDDSFLDVPGRVDKLVSILTDETVNHSIRYEALRALLPVLLFNFADVNAWEVKQSLVPHAKETDIKPENAFIHQTDFWEIWFQGNKLKPIKNLDGMIYIANLLSKPNQIIPVTTLCDSVNPQQKDQAMMGEDEVTDSINKGNMFISTMKDDGLDNKAKETLKAKIRELRETIDDEGLPQSERQKASQELNKLLKTIRNQYSKGALTWRARKKLNEGVKKELDRILKAINRAYENINKQSPELHEYLKKNIKTGTQCVFSDSGILWHISI
jgi:hypothetical protein